MSTLPNNSAFSWTDEAPESTTHTAPAKPIVRPMIFMRENLSSPNKTDTTKTRIGMMVSIIEPSMGDVRERPNIRNDLRKTPINRAAPTNLRISSCGTFSA